MDNFLCKMKEYLPSIFNTARVRCTCFTSLKARPSVFERLVRILWIVNFFWLIIRRCHLRNKKLDSLSLSLCVNKLHIIRQRFARRAVSSTRNSGGRSSESREYRFINVRGAASACSSALSIRCSDNDSPRTRASPLCQPDGDVKARGEERRGEESK